MDVNTTASLMLNVSKCFLNNACIALESANYTDLVLICLEQSFHFSDQQKSTSVADVDPCEDIAAVLPICALLKIFASVQS